MSRKPRYVSEEKKAQRERFKDAMRKFGAEDERRAKLGVCKALYPLADWHKAVTELRLSPRQAEMLMKGRVEEKPVAPATQKVAAWANLLSLIDRRWLS